MYIGKVVSARAAMFAVCSIAPLGFGWSSISSIARERARGWFIERAIQRGIDWDALSAKHDQTRLEVALTALESNMSTPAYFLRPFHGYEDGNMCWTAARELEASTLSMSTGYWPLRTPCQSQYALRDGFVHFITYDGGVDDMRAYVDFGASVGVSTRMTRDALQTRGININSVTAVDLSPYFIAAGVQTEDDVEFLYANIESTPLQTSRTDLVTVCFVFHEMPREATRKAIREAHRILRPGGTLAILDLDPIRLQKLFTEDKWRKFAFEITEPHIAEYYNIDITSELRSAGFEGVRDSPNDPVNRAWVGRKPKTVVL